MKTYKEFDVWGKMQRIRKCVCKADELNTVFAENDWNQLLVSLDIIEDCQEAIDYYIASDYPKDNGKYLFVYGLFQALYMQQDAINALCQIVLAKNGVCGKYGLLKEVRTIRDDLGHPTNRYGNKFIRLVRSDMRKDSLLYVVIEENVDVSCVEADVFKILFDQVYFISHILNRVENKLQSMIATRQDSKEII